MSYFPSHIHIETVAGICSADCVMCTIKHVSRKGILDLDRYAAILTKFEKYIPRLSYLSLFGMGEPLLDKTLPEKVRLAKTMNFPSIGFATNATHLTGTLSRMLIQSGLDTIIFSLDGINKKTHESIRRGTNYDQILKNVLGFIDLRNNTGNTKIIVRMIRQESNMNEWVSYSDYWHSRLNSAHGDQVAFFDVCSYENTENNEFAICSRLQELSRSTKLVCQDLLDRMLVFIDGSVSLCCGDYNAVHNAGNILSEDPEDIYNGHTFTHYRNIMLEGRLTELEYCRKCQLILSQMEKQYSCVR